MLNGMLHYQYIVTVLKIIIYNNSVCFCSQTLEMYLKLNIFNLSVKIGRKLFQKIIFAYVFLLIIVIYDFLGGTPL